VVGLREVLDLLGACDTTNEFDIRDLVLAAEADAVDPYVKADMEDLVRSHLCLSRRLFNVSGNTKKNSQSKLEVIV
jgi:hypothetical protein